MGGLPGTVSAGLQTVTVSLPAQKTCEYCTLQWIWAANQDGGSYIGCADIAITANGALPTYIPNAQRGNVLPGVLATPGAGPGSILVPLVGGPPPPGGIGGGASIGDGSKIDTGVGISGWAVAGVVVLAAGGAYYYYKSRKQTSTTQVGGTRAMGVAPPPP